MDLVVSPAGEIMWFKAEDAEIFMDSGSMETDNENSKLL